MDGRVILALPFCVRATPTQYLSTVDSPKAHYARCCKFTNADHRERV